MSVASNSASFAGYFPLRNPTENDFGELCRSLWGWSDCTECSNRGGCPTRSCQWTQLPSLSPYRIYYHDATYRYTSDDWFKSLPVLQTHGDLHLLIQFIVDQPNIPRECLIASYFSQGGHTQATEADKSSAFNLAYRMITMLPCAERNIFHIQCPGLAPVTWRKSQPASEVWEAAMPNGRTLTEEEVRWVTTEVSAKRLHDYGYKIVDTTDPRLHLAVRSTAKGEQVHVFHQAGFLKQHLSYRGRCDTAAIPIVPRQMAREILYTLRFVLYKWEDEASCMLAAKAGFESAYPGLDTFGYSYDDDFDDQQYRHCGVRMLALMEIVNTSKAGHHACKWTRTHYRWLVKKQHSRVKCATLILTALALVVTTVIGVFGLLMQKQEPMRKLAVVVDRNVGGTPVLG